MNWTSSLLFQSDKLEIVPHLLLARSGKCRGDEATEHEFVRRPNLLLEA